MQILLSKFYGKRALFYWAKMYGSQLDYINEIPTADKQLEEMERLAQLEQEGELGYSGLRKCIVISLMDFNFFNDERYKRYFTLKDGDTSEISEDLDYLELYFIELRKFKDELTGVRSTLERWISFLNNAYKFKTQQLPQELAEIREIQKADLRLKAMYFDEQERMYYDSQQKFWLDQISYVVESIKKAREEGFQEGREERKKEGKEEGKKEGLEEGIKEAKLSTAKNLIKLGFDDETTIQATGLSKSEVEALRKRNRWIYRLILKLPFSKTLCTCICFSWASKVSFFAK